VYMVVAYVKTKQTGREWVRESFVSPRHYYKYKRIMGKDLLEARRVRSGGVRL
jgi:hypothetical protein